MAKILLESAKVKGRIKVRLPDYDFLKYQRVIRLWTQRKYEISISDFEVLLFLYSENIFNYSKFRQGSMEVGYDHKKFKNFKERNLIVVWGRGEKGAVFWQLSRRSKTMIKEYYKMLKGELPIPLKIVDMKDFERYAEPKAYKHIEMVNEDNRIRSIVRRAPEV